MIGLIGVLGGAAALEVRRALKRGDAESDRRRTQRALEQYAQELEQERRSAAAAAERASSLEAQAEALRRERDELGAQRDALTQQTVLLMAAGLALGERAGKIEDENRRLSEQVAELSAARDSDGSRFAADLAALRDRVAEVLSRLFANDVDAAEAVAALAELGCEVHYVPHGGGAGSSGGAASSATSTAPSLSFEPRLLLDDPARMARLMHAAIAAQGASTPRLLEGPSAAAASGGAAVGRAPASLTPPKPASAALTISGPGCAGSGAGGARFTLSWLPVPGADGSEGSGAEQQPQQQQQAQLPQAAALPDVGAPEAADTAKGDKASSGGGGKVVDAEAGKLTFTSKTNKAAKPAQASRLGLSLSFGGGSKKGKGKAALQPDPMSGLLDSSSGAFDDIDSNTDMTLVLRK